jgi:hypothetical protein
MARATRLRLTLANRRVRVTTGYQIIAGKSQWFPSFHMQPLPHLRKLAYEYMYADSPRLDRPGFLPCVTGDEFQRSEWYFYTSQPRNPSPWLPRSSRMPTRDYF